MGALPAPTMASLYSTFTVASYYAYYTYMKDIWANGVVMVRCTYCYIIYLLLVTTAMSSCQSRRPARFISVPLLPQRPPLLDFLLTDQHQNAKHFRQHIRKYNAAFSMTVFKSNEVREPGYSPTYKVQGAIYHGITSLRPPPGMATATFPPGMLHWRLLS